MKYWSPAWFRLGSSLVPHGSASRDVAKHIMFAWFQLGSAWLRIAGCRQTHYVCLGPHRGMSQNTSCLLGSTMGDVEKQLMFAWFQLGSAWLRIAGGRKTHHVCLVPAWFRLAPHRGMSPNTLCLLESPSRDVAKHLLSAWVHNGGC